MVDEPPTGLRRLNIAAGLLHAVSGVVVLVLSNGFALPVTARYMAGPPGSGRYQSVDLGSIPMAAWIVIFFGLSALAHVVVAGPLWERYLSELRRGRNPFRWLEYSLSATVMILAIAQLTGISDVAALIGLAGANAAMIGFGWMQERYEEPGGSLQPFWLGTITGVIPWVAIGVYLFAPGAHQHAPGFVYGIYVSILIFFGCFAVVQFLQYRQIGRFATYLVGERTYIVLSLVAKSLLAWQVFASTLATPVGH